MSDDGKTLYFNGEIADGKSPSMLSEDMKWYESSGQGPVVRSPENKGIEGSFTLSSMRENLLFGGGRLSSLSRGGGIIVRLHVARR